MKEKALSRVNHSGDKAGPISPGRQAARLPRSVQIMPTRRVAGEALPAADPTMRHNPTLGIMTQLMTDGPVKIDRLEKRRGRWHLDVVFARDIEGAVAADADIGAGRADQRLGLRQDQVFGDRRRRRRDVGRKILALVGVENREALEERNRLRFVPGFGGARALAVGNEAVGIDDGGAFLALTLTRGHFFCVWVAKISFQRRPSRPSTSSRQA
jgi:hypothetical protein